MLDAVFALLVDVVFYGTARLVLPLITLGRVHTERAVRAENVRIGWLGTGRDDRGRWVISGEIAALFGCVFLVGIIATSVVLLLK